MYCQTKKKERQFLTNCLNVRKLKQKQGSYFFFPAEISYRRFFNEASIPSRNMLAVVY